MPTTKYIWQDDDDKSYPNVSVELEVSYEVTHEEHNRYTVHDVRIESVGEVLVWLNGHGFRVDAESHATFQQWFQGQFRQSESNGGGLYEAICSRCECDYLDHVLCA